MVRLPFDGELLLLLLRLFDGVCFPRVAQCLVNRLAAKQELQWPELFLTTRGDCYHLSRDCKSIRHTTPLTRRICDICARVPSRLQASVKKDG